MTRPWGSYSFPTDTEKVLDDVETERRAQDARFGRQSHPGGTSSAYKGAADRARERCEAATAAGELTWAHILREEFWEALSEEDPVKLRAGLVQLAAVAVNWAEDLDRKEEYRRMTNYLRYALQPVYRPEAGVRLT